MEQHSIARGMQRRTVILKDSLAISYKAKHSLHMNVYRNFIHSYKKLKATKMSLNWLLGKQVVVCSLME
jgi:hypothetical protein